ncbi:TonB-linked SusC/RagA family outer membrane protein [Chitinophaga skermanii]|uniref:TonB-linked SusC/RagA family outer membrane protein n=1 Tax=Chitinophaga skermanii TaxID=331697 RepID=A0A327QH28_9BACT|nr:SusC/RagA family TonB-linked outer membrane protein [Chitinophaga skermanii]RAJ03926.1 TonB-linked SusC/RagA family outer membrane protein [Chitinophaga skermanii]
MKRVLLLLLLAVAITGQVIAQTRNVKGKVTSSEDGSPIIGATVLVKGTNIGTVTNVEGNYSLNVPNANNTLVVKFVGMKEQEVQVTGETVNVVLQTDVRTLNETVITANAIRRDKSSLGYSAPVIKADELTKGQNVSAINGLSGKVAGVNITGTANAPGSSSRIVLRGGSSITGNNQALLVVDGVPIDNSSIMGGSSSLSSTDFGNRGNDINPDDIESMTVLKGPAAAALYGSRASNGAVIITTKSGKKGKKNADITFSTTGTLSRVLVLPKFQNEYGQGGTQLDRATGTAITFDDPKENFSWGPKFDGQPKEWGQTINGKRQIKNYVAQKNNVKDFFETGMSINNNLALTGGGEKTSYYVSLNALNSNGVMPTSADTYNKYGVRFNGSAELAKNFSTSISVNYTKINSSMIQGGQGVASVYDNVLQTPRDIPLPSLKNLNNPYASMNGLLFDGDGNPLYGYYGAYTLSPYFILHDFKNQNNVDRITGNVTLNYKPAEWVTITNRLGADFYSDRRKFKYPKFNNAPADSTSGEYDKEGNAQGYVGQYAESNINVSEIVNDLMVTFKKTFSSDFNASLMVGNNIRQSQVNDVESQTNSGGLVVPGWYNFNNSNGPVVTTNFYSIRRLVGVYAELNLDYKNFLFLGATARNDWSSTLPSGKNSFFYPSVNASFVFTELMKDSKAHDILNYGKLRASYAAVGNDADPYLLKTYYDRTVVSGGFGSIIFPFMGTPGLSLSDRIGNPNLKPEKTTAFEVGTELGFFENRLYIDFSYYENRSKDLILPIPSPPSIGYTTRINNTGEVKNTGIELAVRGTPVKTQSGFTWELYGTYTRNRNRVIALENGVQQIVIGGYSGMSIVAAVGKPYGTFYAQDIQRDDQGRVIVDPTTGLPRLTEAPVYFGSYNPDYQASLGSNFSYKNWSFSFLFDTKQGAQFFSRTKSITAFNGTSIVTTEGGRDAQIWPNSVIFDQATQKYIPNTTAKFFNYDFYANQNNTPAGQFIVDASYIKLREISLTYRFSKSLLSKANIGDASVGLFGNNVWIHRASQNKFADPEINSGGSGNEQGFDFTAQPSLANFGVNLKITF